MTRKGQPQRKWTQEDTKKLRILVAQGKTVDFIAHILGRSADAVYLQCARSNLSVGVGTRRDSSPTLIADLKLPRELPSIEDALRILAGALNESAKAGLTRDEVRRLQVVANLAKAYKDFGAEYVDYRGIEEKLLDMEEKYVRLVEGKAKNAKFRTGHSETAPSTASPCESAKTFPPE